jgi:hypothetical protein
MIQWETVRHQVAVTGKVADLRTGAPLPDAQVEITAAPAAFAAWLAVYAQQYGDRWANLAERPDRTTARADGRYHFLDLPDGPYTLSASLPAAGSRYGAAQAQATVARDGQGRIALAAADLSLPPTTLRGQVTGQGAGLLVLAEVHVQGSGERAFTDAQGRYLLASLETGARHIEVSARGFATATRTVTLSPAGVESVSDFALVP